MALTPPQFIKMLRNRDRASLVADLWDLTDRWDAEAKAQGADNDLHSLQLRQVLDAHH